MRNPIEQRIAEALGSTPSSDFASMEAYADAVVAACGIDGLTAEDVLCGETPEGISKRWLHRKLSQMASSADSDDYMSRSYALLPFSQLVFESMKAMPDVDNWSFPLLFKAPKEYVDAGRFREAVETAIENHPIFSTRIEADGTQHYEKGYRTPHIIYYVYEEGDNVCFFLSINRILGDSASFSILIEDAVYTYLGQEIQKDDYFAYLQEYEKKMQSAECAVHAQWLEENYGHITENVRPVTDSPLSEDALPIAGEMVVDMSDYSAALAELNQEKGITLNMFFSLATALAIMDYNDTDEAALSWAYMGRESKLEERVFGSLHRDVPFYIKRHIGATPEALLEETRQQMVKGIEHSLYPFTLIPPHNETWNYAVNVLFETSIEQKLEESPFPIEYVPVTSDGPQVAYSLLDVNIIENPLALVINYSATHYKEGSMQRFVALIKKNADWLLGRHHDVVIRLQEMLADDSELLSIVESDIADACSINPSNISNPVQSLPELWPFLDRMLTSLPWLSITEEVGASLFRRMDQTTGYLYFLFSKSQHLPKMAEWITGFCKAWGDYLDSSDSWNDDYVEMIALEDCFGLSKGWYEDAKNWHSWNDFFARRLKDNSQRPIAESEIISPVDGEATPWLRIDRDGSFVANEAVAIKTATVMSVQELLKGSQYAETFAGGWFTHVMLDVNDYHHFHAPVSGTILECDIIPGYACAGGTVEWNAQEQRYQYQPGSTFGFQMLETRGIMVIDTHENGLVAMLPVGMTEVASVHWNDGTCKGREVMKGDELGYFRFGGSDVIILTQKGNCSDSINRKVLMGEYL